MKNWSGRAVVATCMVGFLLLVGAIVLIWWYSKEAKLKDDLILKLSIAAGLVGALMMVYEVYDWRRNRIK